MIEQLIAWIDSAPWQKVAIVAGAVAATILALERLYNFLDRLRVGGRAAQRERRARKILKAALKTEQPARKFKTLKNKVPELSPEEVRSILRELGADAYPNKVTGEEMWALPKRQSGPAIY